MEETRKAVEKLASVLSAMLGYHGWMDGWRNVLRRLTENWPQTVCYHGEQKNGHERMRVTRKAVEKLASILSALLRYHGWMDG